MGLSQIACRERREAIRCAEKLKKLGFTVFSGENQGGVVSFLPKMDCVEAAELLAKQGIAVRAGLHCAPLAHESAGTLETGTVRISFGPNATLEESLAFLRAVSRLL
jgi:selenocysteine lyase/cysteine desulfurase